MSNFLGTLAIIANTKTTFDVPHDGVKAILIGNESGLTVTITMESGGVQKTLYPSVVDWFAVNKGFTGKVLINPTVILNNVSSWPSSSLVFDAIGLNDTESAAQYPIMLPRNTNIGNSVSTNVTATNSISNTDNAPLSTWLTVTPNDAASSTFSGDTSGNFTVKGDNAGVLTTLLQLVAGASPAVKLAAAAVLTEVLGTLQVDSHLIMPNNVTIQGKNTTGTAKDLLVVDSSNITRLVAASTGVLEEIAFFDSSGTLLGWVDAGSIGAPNGVNYNVGRIKDINNGSNLSGTINHGLSGTPAAVLATCDTVSSSATVGASSYTSTQFGLTIGGGLNGRWLAYR